MLRATLSVIGMFLALIISAIKVQAEVWRGIVPLKSTQADVERLLGKPGEHGRYQFDKERAYIHYAGTGPCAKVNRCLCKVSEDTVISIYVELEVEMSFSGLKLDKKHYTKFISRKDPTIATYSNEEIGIIYTVDEKNDDVTAIEYLPTAKDCRDVLRRAKPPRVKTCEARCGPPKPYRAPLSAQEISQLENAVNTLLVDEHVIGLCTTSTMKRG